MFTALYVDVNLLAPRVLKLFNRMRTLGERDKLLTEQYVAEYNKIHYFYQDVLFLAPHPIIILPYFSTKVNIFYNIFWCARQDSNLRPCGYEPPALTS